MCARLISAISLFLLIFGEVGNVHGQDASPEIIGDCRVGLELKPGQGCAVPDGGSFSIRADGCVGDTPSISGAASMSDVSMSAGSLCVKGKWGKGEFGASRVSSDPLTWRVDSLPPGLAN